MGWVCLSNCVNSKISNIKKLERIIHEIESKDKLSVHIKNKETGKIFDATNILPEYFYISVPLFNDRLEKEIDDWLHVMKYDEVPKHYHSPYMKQVAEKLSILKMTQEERNNYSYYQKKIHTDRDQLEAAIQKGREEGREEGIKKEKIAIAKNMISKNYPLSDISSLTGLSIEEIDKLKS